MMANKNQKNPTHNFSSFCVNNESRKVLHVVLVRMATYIPWHRIYQKPIGNDAH